MELLGKYDDKTINYFSGQLAELCSSVNELRSGYFVCTIFFHRNNWSEQELRSIILFLIQNGAVYFLFHGNRCGEAHDLTDEVQLEVISESKMTDRNVIGTTWHEKDSEEEVIFSTFCASLPAADYLSDFRAYLVVSVGTSDDNRRIREHLDDVQLTIRKIVNQEGTPLAEEGK